MVIRRRQRGATYLTLMISVAVVSAALASTAEVVSRAMQRERERQLLWVGEQFRRALVSYARFPAGIDTYPKTLDDLVEDRRRPVVQRHLRRVYHDPMTASSDWGLILNPQQRIIGVHSKSTRHPIKVAGFAKPYIDFENAQSYADWRFGVGTAKEPPPAAKPGSAAAAAGSAASLLKPLPASPNQPLPAPGQPPAETAKPASPPSSPLQPLPTSPLQPLQPSPVQPR